MVSWQREPVGGVWQWVESLAQRGCGSQEWVGSETRGGSDGEPRHISDILLSSDSPAPSYDRSVQLKGMTAKNFRFMLPTKYLLIIMKAVLLQYVPLF